MAKGKAAILAFNRGLVSRLAIGRTDLKRMAFSADRQVNWVPRVLGSMMLRPGLEYLGGVPSRPKFLEFIFSTDDTALVEVTDHAVRVWTSDTLISRAAVSSAVTNGSFDATLAGWTDNDEAGAASTWATGGYAQLLGTGSAAAIRDQQIAVAGADQNVEHALRIIIERGPVTLRVGSTSGGDEYVRETELATGAHSIAFTPTGNFYIRLMSRLDRIVLVDSITIEPSGAMSIVAPWSTDDVRRMRFAQSADVLFVACKGYQQRRIERRGSRSWSVVRYLAEDGPFRTENVGPITITPSGLTGNITLAASAALFRSTHVGALFRLTSEGQRVTANVAAQNTFTSEIRVTGVGESRRFTITRSGIWVATVTLQRSIGETGLWEDVASYTTNDTITFADELDNQIVFYRLGVKTGDYTSGTAVLTLSYPLGSITGVARITAFTTSLLVDAEVLSELGGTDATDIWAEGAWSDYRGWPTAVALDEARLWWTGKNGIWASITDAFDGFDPDFEGSAAPISRTVGQGPVDDINWILPLKRLLLGAEGAEMAIRSSALDEPLTPTNFNIKDVSTQGSAEVAAVKIDQSGVFVQRSKQRVYELAFSPEANDYASTDLTALVPDIGAPSLVGIAVQRQPDTRIHCWRSDGTVALAVIDRGENVLSWQEIETDGEVVDVAVLPGEAEDSVYYVVNRSLGPTGVSALTVTPGAGYTTQPTLTFSGGGGDNAAATIDLAMVSFAIAAAGTGYMAGQILTLSGGTASASALIQVVTVDGVGGVTSALLYSGGDYTVLPSNAVATTGGSGAGCTVNATWGLGATTITSTGSAYSSAPTVTVVGGGGSGGAVTATVSAAEQTGYYLEKWALESECRGGTLNKQADSFIVYQGETTVVAGGYVSAVSVIPGFGYVTPPTVTFSGGGGSGATATATLRLLRPVIYPLGSGYSPGDILTLVGGTYTRPARMQVGRTFGSGQIDSTEVVVIDGGSYTSMPGGIVALTGGTGSGATNIMLAAEIGVGDVTITNPGSGYTSAPTVTFVGSTTVAATGAASISTSSTVVPIATSVIGGLGHLEGKEVVVWGDGFDLSADDDAGAQRTYTVSGGSITLDEDVAQAVIGLPYTAQWRSAKLSHVAGQDGIALNQRKKITQLGLILADTHNKGVKFGPDFTTMDNLPEAEREALVGEGWVYESYDYDMIEFPGEWDTDARLCLQAQAPRPCTVLAAVMAIEEHSKS